MGNVPNESGRTIPLLTASRQHVAKRCQAQHPLIVGEHPKNLPRVSLHTEYQNCFISAHFHMGVSFYIYAMSKYSYNFSSVEYHVRAVFGVCSHPLMSEHQNYPQIILTSWWYLHQSTFQSAGIPLGTEMVFWGFLLLPSQLEGRICDEERSHLQFGAIPRVPSLLTQVC